MNKYKILLLKFKVKYMPKLTKPEDFNMILRMEGITVGKGTIFYGPNTQTIDRQRPWMLKIGEYCKITKGCTILTHDYSRSVLRRAYHDIICEAGETIIGDNVFIGMNSTILMGTHIGNNVIVGAGSVVSGNIPDNCVVAGNPARIIRSLDEHFERRKKKYIEEAKLFVRTYYDHYGTLPSVSKMTAFFPLFLKRDEKELKKYNINTKWNGDEESEIIADFLKTRPLYDSFEAFLEDALEGYSKGDIK